MLQRHRCGDVPLIVLIHFAMHVAYTLSNMAFIVQFLCVKVVPTMHHQHHQHHQPLPSVCVHTSITTHNDRLSLLYLYLHHRNNSSILQSPLLNQYQHLSLIPIHHRVVVVMLLQPRHLPLLTIWLLVKEHKSIKCVRTVARPRHHCGARICWDRWFAMLVVSTKSCTSVHALQRCTKVVVNVVDVNGHLQLLLRWWILSNKSRNMSSSHPLLHWWLQHVIVHLPRHYSHRLMVLNHHRRPQLVLHLHL